MVVELSILNQCVLPLAFIIAGLVAGFLFNWTILSVLRRCCLRAKQEGLDVVAAASSRYIPLWFALLGLYGAVLFAPLSPPISYFLEEFLFIMTTGSVILFIAKDVADLFGLYARRKRGTLPTTSMFKHLIYGFVGIFGALSSFSP